MPVLEFFRAADGSWPFISEELLSVMAFPQPDQQLEAARATLILAREVDRVSQGPLTVDVDLLRLVLAGPGVAEVRRRAADRVVRGTVAGSVLRGLLSMHQQGQRPSVGACIQDLEARLARYETFGGEPRAYRRRSIDAAWSEYRPVAHFWAVAGIAWDQLVGTADDDPVGAVWAAAQWARLMSSGAEQIVHAGMSLLVQLQEIELADGRGRVRLLDHLQPWLVPLEFARRNRPS